MLDMSPAVRVDFAWKQLPAMRLVLKCFGDEARRRARADTYATLVPNPHRGADPDKDKCYVGTCGRCLVANLVAQDFPEDYAGMDVYDRYVMTAGRAFDILGKHDRLPKLDSYQVIHGIEALTALNDLGGLQDPGAVDRLFDGLT